MARRRKSGSGTVRERKDGRWEGRIVIGYDERGLPKTKNVLAKTKTECLEKLEALKETIGATEITRCTPEMPFGEWIDFWYQNYKKLSLRPSTRSAYENVIYNHIIPEIGKIPLEKLNASDLEQFYARQKKNGRLQYKDALGDGVSDRIVRACHAHCRSALEKALEDGLVHTNVAVGCKIPPKKAKEMKVLTEDEMQRAEMVHTELLGIVEMFGLKGRGMWIEALTISWIAVREQHDFETWMKTFKSKRSEFLKMPKDNSKDWNNIFAQAHLAIDMKK
jgi:hypothetical protein